MYIINTKISFLAAVPQIPQQKAQDNFANFDAVFNNFSISDKPPVPQTQPVSNGFLSSTPNIIQSVLEPVMQSQPFESSSLKPEPQKEVKKDDGLPDYSALEAVRLFWKLYYSNP